MTDGQRIRLAGQGGRGSDGARTGDLYLVVRIAPHPRYRRDGRDLFVELRLAPWEAALGTSIALDTPGGEVKVKVPAAAAGIPRCGNCHQPLPWIADAGDDAFAEVAEAASLPVVVDLWAPWCGPCRMVSPALEEVAATLAGRVKLVKVNVDSAPQIQERFGVRAIPTLIVLRQGQVAARRSGAAPAAELRAWVESVIGS